MQPARPGRTGRSGPGELSPASWSPLAVVSGKPAPGLRFYSAADHYATSVWLLLGPPRRYAQPSRLSAFDARFVAAKLRGCSCCAISLAVLVWPQVSHHGQDQRRRYVAILQEDRQEAGELSLLNSRASCHEEGSHPQGPFGGQHSRRPEQVRHRSTDQWLNLELSSVAAA